MSSSPSVSLSWCEGCSSAWWQTGKAVCYLSCWHSKWCCLIRLSLGFTEVRTEAGEEQIYGRLHQQRVWRRGFIESDLGFCPAALTPVCHKQAKPHGSKPGDGVVSWCLAQSRACSGAGAQPMGGTKLGLNSYKARGFLHVHGMEMAWDGLSQLWGTGRKEGFFTSSRMPGASLGAKTSCGLENKSHFVPQNCRYEKQLC